jgi:protein ImuA
MSVAYSIPRLPQQLEALAQQVHAIEARGHTGPELADAHVPTGWADIDAQLAGGLERGVLHEFFGVTNAELGARKSDRKTSRPTFAEPLPLWRSAGFKPRPVLTLSTHSTASHDDDNRKSKIENQKSPEDRPPLCMLAHLARRGLATMPQGWVIWIGKRVWPYPHLLMRGPDGRRLLERSVWIDAPTAAERLWAIDQALRCPAIAAIVADGRTFNMPATRRLQLAARHSRALLLVARPPGESSELSAATTRWSVNAVVSPTKNPRWIATLLRCKSAAQPTVTRRSWVVEFDRAQGHVHLLPDVVDRPASTPTKQTA